MVCDLAREAYTQLVYSQSVRYANASAPTEAKVNRPAPGPIVSAYGHVPSQLYVLGERAGKDEYCQGVPFVGGAGKTLREWFHCAELELDSFRRWNVCIDYQPGNPPPKVWEIKRDRPAVEAYMAASSRYR
jgi:uracil-DNA glycosylase family 4